MTKRETPKQEALRLCVEAGGEFEDIGDSRELKGCAGTGPGLVWYATGCHSCVVHFHTDRPAGWQSLLEDLRKGTAPCDLDDCEICAAGVTIRFFKSNSVTDSGYELDTNEAARRFWASDDAQAWLIKPGQRLERLALNWVNEHLGQWENNPADWMPIYDAIHAAMPRTEPT